MPQAVEYHDDPARLARVSTTPANVVGLSDRERLALGAHADVVIVGGRPVFAAAGI